MIKVCIGPSSHLKQNLKGAQPKSILRYKKTVLNRRRIWKIKLSFKQVIMPKFGTVKDILKKKHVKLTHITESLFYFFPVG